MTRPYYEQAIDPKRVLRAIAHYRAHSAVDIGPHVVIVHGGREAHTVNLAADAEHLCDCGDHIFNERLCVHAIAALLLIGERRTVNALGDVMRDAWLDRAPAIPARTLFGIVQT